MYNYGNNTLLPDWLKLAYLLGSLKPTNPNMHINLIVRVGL